MAFGKRRERPGTPAPSIVETDAHDEPESTRHDALHQTFERILKSASAVAEAVRTGGTVPVFGIADEPDPDASPITLTGFSSLFSYTDGQRKMFAVYGYAAPGDPDRIDPNAQCHIHDLVGRIRQLNLYCQQAHADEALVVALQSPRFPPLIDQVIAGAAYFAAYFANLKITQPFLLAVPPQVATFPETASLKATVDRYMLMASDGMVEPKKLQDYLPHKAWPYFGVETAWRNHDGQQFINSVYFPMEYAKAVREHAARDQASAIGTLV